MSRMFRFAAVGLTVASAGWYRLLGWAAAARPQARDGPLAIALAGGWQAFALYLQHRLGVRGRADVLAVVGGLPGLAVEFPDLLPRAEDSDES